jgi:arylsulfatase A-like enzyme
MMEVYAANVAESDYEIGRIIDALQESGQLDNTLVIYLEGDNGASAGQCKGRPTKSRPSSHLSLLSFWSR